MPVQVLHSANEDSFAVETKGSSLVASVLKIVRAPLRAPAWSVVGLIVMVGVYGYVSGRQNPVHHYVPYVGYPLVLDTTTGKACYSTSPKPSDDAAPVNASYSADGSAATPEPAVSTGPAIPLCGK
jgi:hypothetical protein